ncbi:calcium-binding protein [Lithospermum erythrorhizon]|uniref:Calcium-binding protein n=1 Tax=Lithospermum erythrorhizon TaxID=34254 RepID=A0AAV3QRY9_LITER
MAVDEFKALTKAFSGLGVDEKSLVTILGKWNQEKRQAFRKGTPQFFKEDDQQFERWLEGHVLQLRQEFLRFKDAIVAWTMHPWERDARIYHEALRSGPRFDMLIETACTRSSEDLLGARKAYHSLFERSIEEDITTYCIQASERKLLIALVSAYRYEGPNVHQETAKSEAKIIYNAVKNGAKKKPIEDDEVVFLLSTRSKLHLQAIYKHYKGVSGKFLDEDLVGEMTMKQVVQCLVSPPAYFSQVLHASLRTDVSEAARDSVTRIIITRADVDMKQIKEEYLKKHGIPLPQKLEEVANGNYKEFLLTVASTSD